jgi:hypothetical protein
MFPFVSYLAGTIGLEPILCATKKRCITIMLRSIMVPWERLELSRRKAQVPKTCVSTISPPGLSGAPTRT